MIKIKFTTEEINKLSDIYRNHLHPRVRIRALALILKSENMPHHRIASILNICENTLRSYFNIYITGGIEALTKVSFRKPTSKLLPFDTIIRDYFDKTPPSTMIQACTELSEILDIEIKPEQLSRYCKSIGIKRRKVGSVPGKVDIEAQKEFHDKELQPRLQEAQAGQRAVFFMDAAHFVLGAFLSYLWCFKRVFVRTPSGRQRFNVLGAINAVTKQMINITNNSYISSTQVCELLKKIAAESRLPITVVLDNARYQRCKPVMNFAQELGIELLFLPPYSPNLNLIERVWKFVKKECLNSRYYQDFSHFSHTIKTCVDTMHSKHKRELDTLLSLKFQLFSEEQIKKAA